MPTAKKLQIVPLALNILFSLSFALVGGLITMESVHTWYPGLQKPSFNPPNWLFGPVWSILFICIGVSAYSIWIRRKHIPHFPRTIAIYLIQLILNLGWSFLFFYKHQIDAAFFEILALLIAIVVNGIVFFKIDRVAGLLFVPYFLWVAFASLLNYQILILN